MVRGAFGVIATDPKSTEAASAVLQRGGSALDACLCAWLTAAGLHGGLLLGSVRVLVAGLGVGAFSFDGSVVQPGLNAPRPRGFQPNQPIPAAAFVGVSSSAAAMSAAHAHAGILPLSELAAAGAKLALSEGEKARAALIRRVGAAGPVAFRESSFVRSMLEVAGRPVQGNVTADDLQEVTAAVERPLQDAWSLTLPPANVTPERDLYVLAACASDARGGMAVLHAVTDDQGVSVPTQDVQAPRFAVPVRRGVPRVAPGTRLVMPAAAALLTEHDQPWAAIVVEAATTVDWSALQCKQRDGINLEPKLRDLLGKQAPKSGALVVVQGTGGAAPRVFRVA